MSELTIHEQMLLKIDEAIRDPESPHRDEVNGGVRADRLANSMEGVNGRPAADYAYAIRDLCDTGDVADLSRLRLTEKGALRVRGLREMSEHVINRGDFERGPEPYLGWYLEGTPGPPNQPASYICYASEHKGEGRFQVVVHAPGFNLNREEQYGNASSAAFPLAKGLVFLGTWNQGNEHELTLPAEVNNVLSPQIRDALIRGLHGLYESDFKQSDVTVDYEGVALALGVSESMVIRAVQYLMDSSLVSDEPSTLGLNWKTGTIWLTAAGVEHAEQLEPPTQAQSGKVISASMGGALTWDLFIAHASEDKDDVARPLRDKVIEHGLDVWLDETELLVGDSLRRKIEYGLANSRYGLVILSEHFFAKEWPQRELDGLTAIEVGGRKVILPVWHGVDREYVSRYSPTLADKLAVSTSDGLDHVVEEVLRAILSS